MTVYVGEHNGGKEYWFTGDLFAEVAGGAREAAALKQKELFGGGLLETDRRGHGVSYVVKRPLPDGSGRSSSSFGTNGKSHRALDQALAMAAPVSVATIADDSSEVSGSDRRAGTSTVNVAAISRPHCSPGGQRF